MSSDLVFERGAYFWRRDPSLTITKSLLLCFKIKFDKIMNFMKACPFIIILHSWSLKG